MADLNGMPILAHAGCQSSGGAFLLKRASPVDRQEAIDGWTVELRRGSAYVLARQDTTLSRYEEARDSAFTAALKALDVLSVMRVADLGIRDAKVEHVTWWVEGGEQTLRLTGISIIPMVIRSKVMVSDGTGVLKPMVPAAAPVWHKSFRYFRLAQDTDDLFDAYRNMYLALEAVLDTIAPQKMKAATFGAQLKQDEGEGQWFKRALGEAGKVVPLSPFVPRGVSDPLEALCENLYSTRNRVFHAKGSRPSLLPQDDYERAAVVDRLERLGSLYLALANKFLGLRFGLSFFTQHWFKTIAKGLEDRLIIQVTDDTAPLDGTSTAINPGGGHVVTLTTFSCPGGG